MMTSLQSSLFGVLLANVGFMLCIAAPSPVPTNVVQLAQSVPDLSTLVAAVVAAGLDSTLSGDGPFTVFAPTNAAFDALPAGKLDDLLLAENKDTLVSILTYHVLPAQVFSVDLLPMQSVATVQGQKLTITMSTDGVMVNNVATVTTADAMATNGVAHIIDAVLMPADKNVVEVAQAVPALSTLVQAVIAADLVTTLSGAGPFTVFAPTNAAFDALPAGTLTDLLKPAGKADLVDILTYHVLAVKLLSKDLDASQTAATVQGKELTVTKVGGAVKVNDVAMVTMADQMASNGVAHIIDAVLMPPTVSSPAPKTVVETQEVIQSVADDVAIPVSMSMSSTNSNSTQDIVGGAFAVLPGVAWVVTMIIFS